MTKFLASLYAFNRGLADPLFFNRPDIKRYSLSAEEQTNIIPRVLGPATLRPGYQYLYSTSSNNKAFYIPFIFATDDTAKIEFTDSTIRIDISDAIISRVSVTTTITNGTFGSDIASWTDNDESGATSTWKTGGYMSLLGNGTNSAIREQLVTVAGANQNKEHALRIIIDRGPVTLRVGSTSGGDEYITTTNLGTGTHSLAFTPTGNFYIEFSSNRAYEVLVDSVAVEGSGVMTLPSPYLEADLKRIRFDQSGDVIYLACYGYQQRKIERRGTRSWSIVLYEPLDGPFRTINITPTKLTPSALTGDITVTATKKFFTSTHVGALFRITSTGQKVEASASGADQFTGYIKVTGVGSGRAIEITRSGTWTATITLQRSIAEPGSWADVTTYTTNATVTYNDGLDNQTIYYRIGIETGNYTSGTADLTMTYASGSIDGIFKVTGYTSSTSVSARVVRDLGGTDATDDWYEGAWSDRRGWPSAVALYEGRIYWAGKTLIWGSVADGYESFDDSIEGDAKMISRSIGSGPVDDINWLLPLQRLIIGTDGAEKSARSTSFDEPLTPTNFNLKNASTLGSAEVAAVGVDNIGYFIHRSGVAVYELKFDNATYTSLDYGSDEKTKYAPNAVSSPIIKMAVQRQPDTRIHFVRTDGKVALFIVDPVEETECWVLIETDGIIEDVVITPSAIGEEDYVYYSVKRTINGSDVRFLEKWAQTSDCVGGTLNKQADSFVTFSQSPSTTITAIAPHLIGEQVVVWADGKDYSPGNGSSQTLWTVDGSGSITGLPAAVTTGVIGLPYKGRFKSVKLAYMMTANGPMMVQTALTQRKRVNQMAFCMLNVHHKGLRYGRSFTNMDDLPQIYQGATVATDTVHADYDTDATTFNGGWETDSRICLEMHAPRPCTLLGAVIGINVNEKS